MIRQEFFSLTNDHFFQPIDFFVAEKLLRPFPSATTENACFLAFLFAAAREGHLCVSIDENAIYPDIGVHWEPVLKKGSETLPSTLLQQEIIKKGTCYYLKRNWISETEFLSHWQRLKTGKPEPHFSSELIEKKLDAEQSLSSEQKQAIVKASQNCLTLICGGPGTGKTFTASRLISIFSEIGYLEITVAAPTGKAAGNMRKGLKLNLSSYSAQTLHSLLGVNKHEEKKVLTADLIVVDECSMIDARLMATLFSSIKEGARLVLVGDPNQLLPIESGNFFADLYHHDPELRTELTRCVRTENQELIRLSQAIKKGDLIPYEPLPTPQEFVSLLFQRLGLHPKNMDKIFENFRILSPMRRGLYGVDYLNQLILEKHRILARGSLLKIPILITSNEPSIGLFNGDIGFFVENEGYAYFGDQIIHKYRLPNYELAYAISVHKSQGSEYDDVWLIVPEGAEQFGREMLYTASTRAKQSITLFAEKDVLRCVISKSNYRYSGFFRAQSL